MKKTLFLTLLMLFSFIHVVSANTVTERYDSSRDAHYVETRSATIKQYNSNGDLVDELKIGSSQGYYFRCNGHLVVSFDAGGSQTVSINQISSEASSCYPQSDGDGGGDSGGGDSGGGGSNCGCIFNTPGWQGYMGKVDQIINKIPSPPNWNNVAGTFSDRIVPRLISGVDDMLGRAPSLPNKPSSPGSLNDRNLKKPTGQDSGLKGFNDRDIKNGSAIKENKDESGGWNILDPLESMPDQETFVPEEGDLKAPEVPDVEGEAPEPEEPENKTPSNPKEPENPAPTPDDPGGTAPTPSDPGGNAPTPSEPENQTPSNPKEPENVAPTPSEPSNTAPTPSEPSNPAPTPGGGENQFPIPGENNGSYPMPGSGSNQAPIPGRDNTQAPMPGQSGLQAPIPK